VPVTKMVLRANLTKYERALVALPRVWHCDAWLFEERTHVRPYGELYFVHQYRRAGRDIIDAKAHRVTLGDKGATLQPIYVEQLPTDTIERAIGDKWSRQFGLYDHLNALHWRELLPLATKPADWGTASVALHYIYQPSDVIPINANANEYDMMLGARDAKVSEAMAHKWAMRKLEGML
jgi:hypothetical protein